MAFLSLLNPIPDFLEFLTYLMLLTGLENGSPRV